MKWNPFSRAARRSTAPSPSGATAPASYAEWSLQLDLLARGDDDEACLQRLQSGTLQWSAGVAPLFVQRLSDEVQRRLNVCADRLQRDLQRPAVRSQQEAIVVRAIVQARAQLAFLHRLCQLPAMPESVRRQLADEVRKFAERSQQSLEDSAKADRSGQLESWLRNNPLTRYQQDTMPTPAAAPTPADTQGNTAQPRRRNILT